MQYYASIEFNSLNCNYYNYSTILYCTSFFILRLGTLSLAWQIVVNVRRQSHTSKSGVSDCKLLKFGASNDKTSKQV